MDSFDLIFASVMISIPSSQPKFGISSRWTISNRRWKRSGPSQALQVAILTSMEFLYTFLFGVNTSLLAGLTVCMPSLIQNLLFNFAMEFDFFPILVCFLQLLIILFAYPSSRVIFYFIFSHLAFYMIFFTLIALITEICSPFLRQASSSHIFVGLSSLLGI